MKWAYKIKDLLDEKQLEELKHITFSYAKFSRIYFKVLRVDKEENIIHIEVRQERNLEENYFSNRRLVEIVEETFRPYFQSYKLYKFVKPFVPFPAKDITPEWIKKKMNFHKIGNKKIAIDFGLQPSETSAFINGRREMGNKVKSLFYFYFKFVELQKKKHV